MPRITILAVGKLKAQEAELYQRYLKRLRPAPKLIELSERQADRLMDRVPEKTVLVCMDERGDDLPTVAFGEWMSAQSRDICFVIGAAEGLPKDLLARADKRIRFGSQTWPHQLVRAMLVEQLYRVQSIQAGHPYHKA